MQDDCRDKITEIITWHSELEQSELKSEAALLSILSLTQITELKLLLDLGRRGHRFFTFVLTLLVACIGVEVFVGMIIIYVGNMHYKKMSKRPRGSGLGEDEGGKSRTMRRCRRTISCLMCCCRKHVTSRKATYMSTSTTGHELLLQPGVERPLGGDTEAFYKSGGGGGAPGGAHRQGETTDCGCLCCLPALLPTSSSFSPPLQHPLIALNEFDRGFEASCVTLADLQVRVARARHRVDWLEGQLARSPSGSGSAGEERDLNDELARWRRELDAASRLRDEAETEKRLCELQQTRTAFILDRADHRRHLAIFSRVARWQHITTYLLYLVLIMNVVITTFGISGESLKYRDNEFSGSEGVGEEVVLVKAPPVRWNITTLFRYS